jgi:hypothetical protein
MRSHRVYTLVFLVLVGGLFLEILPPSVFLFIDTIPGRSLGFLSVTVVGAMLGVPEAILMGTIVGLCIDRSHDMNLAGMTGSSTTESPVTHSSGILKDLSPTYTGDVARRLGLVSLANRKSIMDNDVSYRIR